MPHIDIKLFPGRSDEMKKAADAKIVEAPQFCRYFWNTITRKPVFIRLPRFFYFIFMSCFDCERRRNVL